MFSFRSVFLTLLANTCLATDAPPTIFVLGDSTARNSAKGRNGEQCAGWGTPLADYFDPDKAVQTLTDAGYTVENSQLMKDGKAIPIELTFSDSPRNRIRFEWLSAKYKEGLGIDMPLNPVESTTYTNLTKDVATAPQMFILGWCADYPDPQNWLSVYWKTGAFGERIGYSNPELDALMAQADSETDEAVRMDLYAQAQTMLTDGIPVAFMWNNVNAYLIKPWVQGVSKTPMDAGWAGGLNPLSITVDAAAQMGGN